MPLQGRPAALGWGLVVAALLGAAGGAPAAARRSTVLVPERAEVQRRAPALQRLRLERQHHWPAFLTDTRRNPRLRAQGLLTSPAARAAKPATAADPDTARVLLVRLGFRTNRQPELTSMDASGDFRLQADSSVAIDPPPHDARYFGALLEAMRSYWELQSYGALTIEGTVFPAQEDSSIKLGDVADYGPGPGGFWTLEPLERYFRDAVARLGTAAPGQLDLSRYDAFVFVHPGSDLQNDLNRDSPNDLPTFTMTLADSIVVQDSVEVRSGLIIPESLNQDGALGGVLGALCHEFGHALGLPDWYDTHFGLPVVGEWTLMDSGNAALFAFSECDSCEVQVAWGVLPTGLSAVDRMLLRWDEPYVLQAPADEVVLRPTNSVQGDGPRSARLDVSADEYFIVENRRDVLYEHPDDIEACAYLNRDDSTGVVLWMSKADAGLPPRLRRNSGEYDYFISSPTAPDWVFEDDLCSAVEFGLLVWHVDERRLAEGYPTNEVNVDETMRALRIVEASGDFEIGDWRMPTVSFVGDGWNDPFRDGYRTELRAGSVPNNWNSDWAQTGWEITNVEFVAPESHRLSVRVLDGVAGWHRTLRSPAEADSLPPLEPRGAVLADVSGLGRVLVMADSSGVHAWGPGGAATLHAGPVQPASLTYVPRLAAGDSVGTLAALDATSVWLWEARLAGGALPARAGFPRPVDGGAGPRLVLWDDGVVEPGGMAERAAGGWFRFRMAGGPAVSSDARSAPPVVGRFDADTTPLAGALVGDSLVVFDCLCGAPGQPGARTAALQATWAHGLDAPDSLLLVAGGALDATAGTAQVVVLRRDGALRVVDPQRGVLPGFADLPPDAYIGLALGDVNGDGELDLVAASRTRLVGMTGRGARLLNTPILVQDAYALRNRVQVTAGPLLADVAGDALPEILVTTDLGLVYVFDGGGRPVSGYPRKVLPDLFPAALLAGDVDGDAGAVEVVAVSAVSVVALAPDGGSGRVPWGAEGGEAGRRRFAAALPPVQAAARLRRLERPILAHPNPSRDGLVQLRITALQPGPYDVRIYNLEGEQVFESRGMLTPGTVEIPWRCGRCASGVYLARFVSPAAGVITPLVEPITVVR